MSKKTKNRKKCGSRNPDHRRNIGKIAKRNRYARIDVDTVLAEITLLLIEDTNFPEGEGFGERLSSIENKQDMKIFAEEVSQRMIVHIQSQSQIEKQKQNLKRNVSFSEDGMYKINFGTP